MSSPFSDTTWPHHRRYKEHLFAVFAQKSILKELQLQDAGAAGLCGHAPVMCEA
jgi:hypothetical protein